ncbi:sulfotransferase family protein [Paraburkholderia bannensis]|uniref:hypothetical protein n=1 Tax=Paraburkholderia bannensis TaxID=765414 RepID=UPI0038B9041D
MLYLNHIPKTAGTSLRNTLERVFPSSAHNSYWFVDEYLADTRERLDAYALLSGHLLMLPVSLSDRAHDMVTFLREPASRAYSHYVHLMTDAQSGWREMIAGMTFEDFLFSPVAEAELLSFQARHLGILEPQVHFETKDRLLDKRLLTRHFRSRNVLANAKAVLDRAWFVGFTERYAESVGRLSAQMGVPLDPGARLNGARRKGVVPVLTESARNRLAWLNEFDDEIYEYALGKFDNKESPTDFELASKFFKSHIDFLSGFVGGGWHPVEQREGRGYCWSAATNAWVMFLAPWKGASFLSARLATWVADDLVNLRVMVNGQDVQIDLALAPGNDGRNFMYLTAPIPASLGDSGGKLVVEFLLERTVRPCDVSDDPDDRDLGVYVNWLRLVPAAGFATR